MEWSDENKSVVESARVEGRCSLVETLEHCHHSAMTRSNLLE